MAYACHCRPRFHHRAGEAVSWRPSEPRHLHRRHQPEAVHVLKPVCHAPPGPCGQRGRLSPADSSRDGQGAARRPTAPAVIKHLLHARRRALLLGSSTGLATRKRLTPSEARALASRPRLHRAGQGPHACSRPHASRRSRQGPSRRHLRDCRGEGAWETIPGLSPPLLGLSTSPDTAFLITPSPPQPGSPLDVSGQMKGRQKRAPERVRG